LDDELDEEQVDDKLNADTAAIEYEVSVEFILLLSLLL